MSLEQRKELLQAARSAVERQLARGRPPRNETTDMELQKKYGVFVSVHVAGDLRGCTGYIYPDAPLIDAVSRCAVSAATADHRFDPVRPHELDDTVFEISVLSKPAAIADPSRLEIGRHGIIISSGLRKGLLLPQVATRHGMGREEFLDAGCRKAGLPEGSWRSASVTVEVFAAEVFGEASGDR